MPQTSDVAVRRRYHLTWGGVVFVLLTVLIGAATSQRRENLLVWVFASMLAWVIVSGLLSGGMMMAVRVRRVMPTRGAVGDPLHVRYDISSVSKLWSIFDLRIVEQTKVPSTPARLQHCARGTTHASEGKLHPTTRGLLRMNRIRCASGFPFGLIVKSVEFAQPADVMIHPKISRLRVDTLPRLLARAGGTGQQLTSVARGSDEIQGLREYRAGDSLRTVAWRRSAMLPALVVMDRSAPNTHRLCIVLDLRLSSSEPLKQSDEHAIAMTASLVVHAQRAGWDVMVDVLGCGVDRTLDRTLDHRAHEHHAGRGSVEVLDALASIDLDQPRTTTSSRRRPVGVTCLTIRPGGGRPICSDGPLRAHSVGADFIATLCEVERDE